MEKNKSFETVKDKKIRKLLNTPNNKREIKQFINREIVDQEKSEDALSFLIRQDKKKMRERVKFDEADENNK